jgi:hypothetical protein
MALEVRNDNVYRYTCAAGHEGVTVLQQQKFEVLFEVGVHALVDGYHREAVSSFAASLERFYEFFCRAALYQQGLDADLLNGAWKHVSLSERQVGAYVAAYLTAVQEVPILLSTNQVRFRNSVIHRGHIPDAGEAIGYGKAVLDVARPAMGKLKAIAPVGVQRCMHEHLERGHGGVHQRHISTLSIGTALSLNWSGPDIPLEEWIDRVKRGR